MMLGVPKARILEAGTVARSSVGEMSVVSSMSSFHFTIELKRKSVPVAVRENSGSPIVSVVGEIVVSTGAVQTLAMPSTVPLLVAVEAKQALPEMVLSR